MAKEPLIPKDVSRHFGPDFPYTYSFGYSDAYVKMLKDNLLTEEKLKAVLDAREPKFSWLRLIGFSTVMYLSWKLTSDLYELFMKKEEKPSRVDNVIETQENGKEG